MKSERLAFWFLISIAFALVVAALFALWAMR